MIENFDFADLIQINANIDSFGHFAPRVAKNRYYDTARNTYKTSGSVSRIKPVLTCP